MHEINKSFDCNPTADVKGTFLDISKAFDKAWQEGWIYKSDPVENKLLNLIKNYFANRQQHVLLNRRTSKLTNLLAAVPQGSVIGPFLLNK